MPVVISPYALTTLATAKDHLGIPTGNNTYDDRITRMINAATDRIETFTDRYLKKRTAMVEFQDGFAQNRILLGQWPAVKPSELWIDCTGKFTDVSKKLTTDQYDLDYSARGEGIGVLLHGRTFPRGFRNIKIVYDAGYDSIPASLEDCCLHTVAFLYDMRDDKRIGVSTKGKNQENTTFLENLPEFVQETLLSYKRVEWPTGDRQVWTG